MRILKMSFWISKRFRELTLSLGLVALGSNIGCASLKSVSFTQMPKDRSHPVSASSESWGFLALFSSNDFVDELSNRLKEQCPDGRVTGIFTKHENYNYFVVLKRVVRATGYCESGAKSAAPAPRAASSREEVETPLQNG